MVTLSNPESPATKKQLWLLHILTKTDTRKLDITMLEASKRIGELKHNNGTRPQGDKARADCGTRPLVNPHASAINQDKQKLAQARYDKTLPEREVIQGTNPTGDTDMVKIEAHFKANAYAIGREFAGNDTASIDFYDFNCKDCLFGQTGICQPNWTRAGFTTCQQIIESVNFSCHNFEPVQYSISEYCNRPKGKQCQRKHINNACLTCGYRTGKFIDSHNRHASARYTPTLENRISQQQNLIAHLSEPHNSDYDYTEGITAAQNIIALLNKLM